MREAGALRIWIVGARPKTLPAAIVPVLVGTAAAADADLGDGRGLSFWRFLGALVVSLALQVGVNYANDYSDGVRGTDDSRVGPLRLVGSGAVAPAAVKRAAFVSFGVAALAGLGLAAVTSWWLVAVGLVSILAAWFYTGGPNPYGYLGLGELFVFIFFGLVATVGSTYVQTKEIATWPVVCAIPVGLLATALLVTNNLRDIPTDALSGKRTLAVRLGDPRTRILFLAMLAGAFIGVVVVGVGWRLPALLGLVGCVALPQPWRRVRSGAVGADLIPVLVGTGRVQLLFGAGFALGLFIGA
ncbi:MAG: 1,4-dihydroxy-2-naphthoate polyprenyltransferase [Acidimicrobiales bacterium]